MHNSLFGYEELVEKGYIRKQEHENLVQYTYTEQTEHEKYWNEYTRSARGIIFEKETGKLIAKPFDKFFNLGTQEETFITNLPNLPYTVYDKLDGSLGIIYWYNEQWNVATKGSFNSEQAIKAQELLKKYDLNGFPPDVTLLVEIIYPENKIVINYGDREELILIGAIDTTDKEDYNLDTLKVISERTKIPLCRTYDYTIEQMIELQKTIPKDQEGFVVRWSNGFRVKIKGDEYCKIHKIISYLSPLSFWEVINKDGKVDSFYLIQIPEEYRQEFESTVKILEKQYKDVYNEIERDLENLPSKTDKREIGIFINSNNHNLKHPKAIFPYLTNKDSLHKYILNTIRPTGNNFKNV